MSREQRIDRRGVIRAGGKLVFGVALVGLGAVASAWTAAVARFLGPNRSDRPGGAGLAGGARFGAGFPTAYADGRVETKYRERYGVWIVRDAFGSRSRIYALRSTCTHLGCMTVWREGEQRFRCPCHGSAFAKSGLNVAGPAPRPLERCAIRLTENGEIEIDSGRTFREDLGQWTDVESFLEV